MTRRMYRVLHVITGLGSGGAEAMLHKLLSRTEGEHFSSSVISLLHENALERRVSDLGVPVYKLELRSARTSLNGVARLCRLARQIQPTIIQGWMPHGNLAGLLAKTALFNGVPLVWGVRQSLYDLGYETPATARLIRLCAKFSRLPRAIVYNSHTGRLHHESLGFFRDRGTVIPNGFDVELFVPSLDSRGSLRKELEVGENNRLVGIVGRFHPMKDHLTFIRAATSVLKRHPECRFVMVGPDMDWHNKELTSCLQDAELSDATYLLGIRDDIPRINAALDIAVSSSFTEAFSNVIGEAMSCGVPCVATDVGDSALLLGGTGIVVPPRDPEKLASGINQLLDLSYQDLRTLGLAARKRVVSEFSLDKVASSFTSLYLSVGQKERAEKTA